MTLTINGTASNNSDPADLYRYDRVASVCSLEDEISDSQVQDYWRDGYIAFENVLTTGEVDEARQALSDLIHGKVADYKGLEPEKEHAATWQTLSAEERADTVRKLFLFSEFEPRLKWVGTEHTAIQRILTRLLGEPPQMIQDMALLKPPHIGREKPWHQDMAYFRWGPPEKIIGVWIALDPATAENGCMHVVPGTHREGCPPLSRKGLPDGGCPRGDRAGCHCAAGAGRRAVLLVLAAPRHTAEPEFQSSLGASVPL
jgi:phytanoyl-CoA hydroxylase